MRLFVAVWPSPGAAAALARLARPARPGLRWTTPDQWHVTLRFLGQVAQDDVGVVAGALAAVAAGAPGPAPCRLGPATTCFGPGLLVVPVLGLEGLAAATAAATSGVGRPPGRRPFAGHLTLARSRPRGPDLRQLAGQPAAAAWTASELTLVSSRTVPTGARYEVLRRFPLPA